MTRTTIQISNPRDLPQLMAPLAFLLACDKVPQAGFEPDTGLTLELIVLKKRKGASPTWWRSCNRWGSWPRRWSPREGGSHSSGRENWLEERKTWKRKKVGRKSDWEPSALDPVLDHEELANDEDDPGQVEDNHNNHHDHLGTWQMESTPTTQDNTRARFVSWRPFFPDRMWVFL